MEAVNPVDFPNSGFLVFRASPSPAKPPPPTTYRITAAPTASGIVPTTTTAATTTTTVAAAAAAVATAVDASCASRRRFTVVSSNTACTYRAAKVLRVSRCAKRETCSCADVDVGVAVETCEKRDNDD